MTRQTLRIGTRTSPLAMRQAEAVAARLRAVAPDVEVTMVGLEAQGDQGRWAEASLMEVGGTGVFTAALERALLDGRVDVVVHSLKDLPTRATPGLVIAALPEREDPADVLITRAAGPASGGDAPRGSPSGGRPTDGLLGLPSGARVGTSSLRRAAQVLRLRPDVECLPIRGNVGTRLRKLSEGQYDAILLAAAGLVRLGYALDAGVLEEGAHRFSVVRLPLGQVLPAPGQGALAVQVRARDRAARDLVAAADDPEVRACVTAERALLAALEAGCRLPVAGYAAAVAGRLRLQARVVAPDGSAALDLERRGALVRAAALGRRAARALLDRGAARLLDGCAARGMAEAASTVT